MKEKEYNKWLNGLSEVDKIKYFISLINNPKKTKMDRFGGFIDEVGDYRFKDIRKKEKAVTKKSNYDKEVIYFSLENCRKSIAEQYTKLSKSELKKLPQYKLLRKEIRKHKLSREYLIMALVTYHIVIYRIQEQFYSADKSYIKTINKGTRFYHGRFAYNAMKKKRVNFVGETWISRDKHNAMMYASQANDNGARLYDNKGITIRDDYEWLMYVFKAKSKLKLLNINLDTILRIKKEYPYIIPLVEYIFPINEDGTLGRKSKIEYDYVFSLFVCYILKLDGYTASCFTHFQTEEMVCNIKKSLTEPVVYMWKGSTIKKWLNEKYEGKVMTPNEQIAFVLFYQQFANFEYF